MKLRYLSIILAAILIAAHFLRSFSLIPMAICLFAPFLLMIKKRHRSWMASAIILGIVALFTLFAGWLLNSQEIKERYTV